MLRSTSLIAAAAFFAIVNAQAAGPGGYTGYYSTSGPLAIDPNGVDPILRNTWCNAEKNTCPMLCGGSTSENSCDQNTFDYSCQCANGPTPNVSDYMNTLPFFICQAWRGACADDHPDDLDGKAGCYSVQCGQKNASELAVSTSSAPSSTPTESSSSGGSSGSSASPTASSTGAAAAMNVAQNYGTGIVAAGFLAMFGLAL